MLPQLVVKPKGAFVSRGRGTHDNEEASLKSLTSGQKIEHAAPEEAFHPIADDWQYFRIRMSALGGMFIGGGLLVAAGSIAMICGAAVGAVAGYAYATKSRRAQV